MVLICMRLNESPQRKICWVGPKPINQSFIQAIKAGCGKEKKANSMCPTLTQLLRTYAHNASRKNG